MLERDREGKVAFVARRYAGTVVAIDVASGTSLWETKVGTSPRALLLHDSGPMAGLLVSDEDQGMVSVLDMRSGRILRQLRVGPSARGFAVVGDRLLVVALFHLHRLSVWDLVAGREVHSVPVEPFPAAVAVSQERGEVYVGHFFDGAVSVVSSSELTIRCVARGDKAVNLVVSVLPCEGGRGILVGHSLTHDDQPDPQHVNAVLPAVSMVNPKSCVFEPSRRLDLALLGRPVSGAAALALLRQGQRLLVANSLSNDVSVIDLVRQVQIANIQVGRYPLGAVVTPDERFAWVANAHEHSLSVIDLSELREVRRIVYGQETLSPRVARGRDLFHDASSSRMADNHWLTCASCHPDGGSDGRVWSLPGRPGRLRTKDLRHAGLTFPSGWRGDRDEFQDEEHFIRGFQHGKGLLDGTPYPALGLPNAGRSQDLDSLAEYLLWLRHPLSPRLVDGHASPAAELGRTLFMSERLGCSTCHPPPLYTSRLGKVPVRPRTAGAPEPGADLGLDTPSLLGLFAQRRFLHDGRASTVADVFTRWNEGDHHGRTSHLSPEEMAQLEAFLLSLPDRSACQATGCRGFP
jgi:YVTN family beta-propeller protein